MTSSANFLPSYHGYYGNEFPTRAEEEAREQKKRECMEARLNYLASIHFAELQEVVVTDSADITSPHSTELQEVVVTEPEQPISSHSEGGDLYNLACYFLANLPEAAASWVSCFVPAALSKRCTKERKYPVTEAEFKVFRGTEKKFLRNTFGLVALAPAVIFTQALAPTTPQGAIALTIITNLLILLTAGFNTYVFSGDIGIQRDAHGTLVLRGGQRVHPILAVGKAYDELGNYLTETWKAAVGVEKENLEQVCREIKNNWSYISEGLESIGMSGEDATALLGGLRRAILDIIDPKPVPVAVPHPETVQNNVFKSLV